VLVVMGAGASEMLTLPAMRDVNCLSFCFFPLLDQQAMMDPHASATELHEVIPFVPLTRRWMDVALPRGRIDICTRWRRRTVAFLSESTRLFPPLD
jgi:hypothetical protein